jgi:hypothetical protein
MSTMPGRWCSNQHREALRREFDTAVNEIDQSRPGSQLTSDFYAGIGNSVFDAGYDALGATCAPKSPKRTPSLHVVSAPVGSGKTSFAVAFIAALVRLGSTAGTNGIPFGCVVVVDQIPKADTMFKDLQRLLPGKVAVWTTDHDQRCKQPTKVSSPAARFTKDDLQHYPVAIVTHAFYKGKGGHKARQVLHQGKVQPRALTVIDERTEDVTVFDIEYSAAEAVRERIKADERDAVTVGPHMDALARFMFDRTFGGGSIEKPTDDQEAWKAVEHLQWFATEEASAFVRDHQGVPNVNAVFGFARALATDYAFIARSGKGDQNTHFIGYENGLILVPGMLLLDATADIDGVSRLCPWREHSKVPQARYDNLSIIHVPTITKKKLGRYLKVAKNRRDYVSWMIATITEHMEPGQKGLVVCKQALFQNENIPDWREGDPRHKDAKNYREKWGWDVGGRALCAVHWGTGIGDNIWQEADVVFLFDEFHLSTRTIIATAQGLQQHRATEGDLASMKTLLGRAPAVTTLREGHLLRWTKQMALRGRGRRYDENGVCGCQKLVCTGDLKRLVASADRLFPGAPPVTNPASSGSRGGTQARAFLTVLSRPGLPPRITTRWISQQLKMPWRDVGKHVMKREDVRQGMEHLRWDYRPAPGRGGGAFVRLDGEPQHGLGEPMAA